MSSKNELRRYERDQCITFLKTKEAFGGLSNMAGGFPLKVNGFRILTSEALYQACRFPHLPDAQRIILAEISPMTAKIRSRQYRHDSRPDWKRSRIRIMRWCLRVKLAQNWEKFSELLLTTGDRPIVEESRKDGFWGAKLIEDGVLVGSNVLGRLLMELREEVKTKDRKSLLCVEPLPISDFLLDDRSIQVVQATNAEALCTEHPDGTQTATPVQTSFFDQPT